MKIFFGTPVRDHVHAHTANALDHVKAELRARGIPFQSRLEPRGSLPLAHSLLAHEFMRSDATHLLIVHSDVAGFTADDVVRMASSGEDVVGAPIPGRSFEPDRIRNALAAGIPPERAWLHAAPMLFWPKPGGGAHKLGHLLEVEALSTGFLMITKRAIEGALQFGRRVLWGDLDLAYVFEEATDASDRLCSEDSAFCIRWRAAGGIVWADTKTSLTHWGEASFHAAPLDDVLRPRDPNLLPGFRAAFGAYITAPPSCQPEARAVLAGQYELGLEFDRPPTVLDLGANVGSFARWALARWPGARVDCYEPQGGDVAAALHANAQRTCGLVTVHELAVTRGDATHVELHVRDDHPIATSIVPDERSRAVRVPAVDAVSLPDVDVLKLDIEGDEPAVLERYLSRDRRSLRGVAVEWHTEGAREALREVLGAHRFHVLEERPLSPDRLGIGVMLATRIDLAHA